MGSVDDTPCSAGRKSFIYNSWSLNCQLFLKGLLRLWGFTGKSEKEEIQFNFNHREQNSPMSPALTPPEQLLLLQVNALAEHSCSREWLTHPFVPFQASENEQIFSFLLQNHKESCQGHHFLRVNAEQDKRCKELSVLRGSGNQTELEQNTPNPPQCLAPTGKALSSALTAAGRAVNP